MDTSTEYEFRVQSETKKNDSSQWVPFFFPPVDNDSSKGVVRSEDLYNETKSIPLAPKRLEVQFLSATSINLTWVDMGKDYNYTVCYFEVNDKDDCEHGHLLQRYSIYITMRNDVNYHIEFFSKSNSLEVRNLKPSTLYEFKVRTHSSNGSVSTYSHSLEISTLEESELNSYTYCNT